MKKAVLIFAVILLSAVLALTSSAVPAGTVVNHTLYTDIVARIDGHPIRAYNVDNRMVIVAEDLRAYGFWVLWDEEARRLDVVRPLSDGKPAVPWTYPDRMPDIPAGKIGTPADEILATDIVATVAGKPVESWNIDGETVITFRDLAVYGSIVYSNAARTAYFKTADELVILRDSTEQTDAKGWWAEIYGNGTKDSFTFTVSKAYDGMFSLLMPGSSAGNAAVIKVSVNPVTTICVSFSPPENFLKPSDPRVWLPRLYQSFSDLPLPSSTETVDFTNTPELRTAVASVFRAYLNGVPVTGDLWHSQREESIDFIFLFDRDFSVNPGDIITVELEPNI